jgi:hypothetical protein
VSLAKTAHFAAHAQVIAIQAEILSTADEPVPVAAVAAVPAARAVPVEKEELGEVEYPEEPELEPNTAEGVAVSADAKTRQ